MKSIANNSYSSGSKGILNMVCNSRHCAWNFQHWDLSLPPVFQSTSFKPHCAYPPRQETILLTFVL